MNQWKLKSNDNGKVRHFDSRAEAEDAQDELSGIMDTEIIPPETNADGGAEVVEVDSDASDAPTMSAQELPDEKPGVDTDPMEWVPGDFVDRIDGTPAINRKGYEVMCQHFGVNVSTEMIESPSASEWQSCIHKATATTKDGVTYTAYGSAHVERGDDKTLLVEMSDTRAYKRAASRATGVGMVAVEELQNQP